LVPCETTCHMNYLSTKEVAARAGISRGTLEKYLAAGELRPPRVMRVGRMVVRQWTQSDVDRVRRHKKLINARLEVSRKEMWADPAYLKRLSVARKKMWTDPAYRARMIAYKKKAWTQPEYRKRITEGVRKAFARPEVIARMSAAGKKRWKEDSAYRARTLATLEKIQQDPKIRERHDASVRKAMARPEVIARKSMAAKKHWKEADPAHRERVLKVLSSGRLKAARRVIGATGGRPKKQDLWINGAALKKEGLPWSQIARRLTPDSFRNNHAAATHAMSVGVRRWLQNSPPNEKGETKWQQK